MEELRFKVQGSASDPYDVTFRLHGTNLSAYCTCPAGVNGQYCKHRFGIMAGQTKGIVSRNESDVAIVHDWVPGTDVEAAIQDLVAAEDQLADAKKDVSAAKKRVAAAMRD